MKNTAMPKCYYLVQPTDMEEKLNMELFCKFWKAKVTVPSPPPPAYYTRAFLVQGGGGYRLRIHNLCAQHDTMAKLKKCHIVTCVCVCV